MAVLGVRKPTLWLLPLVLAPFLLWPAVWNGGPLIYYDTYTYLRRPADLLGPGPESRIFPPPQPRAPPAASPAPAKGPAGMTAAAAPAAQPGKQRWLAGRSIYYGLPAAMVWALLSVWVWLWVQGTAVLLPLGIAWFKGVEGSALGFTGLTGLLTLGTTAPVFASFLMPDIFTGVLVVAAATLIAFHKRLGLVASLILVLLIAWAGASHDSHIPMLGGFALLAALLALARARTWRPAILLGVALGLALAAALAFHLAARLSTGEPPQRYPFLVARTVATPHGVAALRARCPASDLILCRFVDQIGTEPGDWNDVLFERHPSRAVWTALDPDGRERLLAEQGAVVRLIAAHDPLAFTVGIMNDWWIQLGHSSLDSLAETRIFDEPPLPRLRGEEGGYARLFGSRQAAGIEREATLWSRWSMAVAGLAFLAGAFAFARAQSSARVWALVVLLGWIGQAMVVGTLARPNDRFGARTLWLVPVAAAFVVGSALHNRRRKDEDLRYE